MNRWRSLRGRLGNLPTPARLRAFAGQLRGPHRTSAFRAALDAVVVALTLRRRGLRPLVAGSPPPGRKADAGRAAEVSVAVDAGLGVLPMAPTCLRRSVTLLRELERLDLEAGLHLGVRTVDGRIEAHAWIQVGDVVVNDDPSLTSTYTELADGRSDELLGLLR